MATRDQLVRSFQARTKRKPPKPYQSPGLRHYLSERHSVPAAQQIFHDGSVSPAGTGPFRRPRRGRTRPTPGSYYGRKWPRPD